jgi:hypothetical protein
MFLRTLYDSLNPPSARWQRTLAIVIPLLLMIVGCGKRATDYSSLNLATVTGKITLNKEPLVGATVVFEGEAGRFAFGTTDEYGRYKMMFNSEQAGVLAGKKKVRVTMSLVGESAGVEVDPDGEDPDGEDPDGEDPDGEDPDGEENNTDGESAPPISIPARYNSATTLEAIVEAGKSQQFDFDLESP